MTNALFINRNLRRVLPLVAMLVVGLLTPAVTAQPFREFPPHLPPTFSNVPLNGGRVHSIAVSPTDRDHIIASHQFGGLWQTVNGGRTWYHLNGLQGVFITDVAYASDGRTVIATVQRDTKTVNGGGIWVSRNEGETWEQASDGSGTVPVTVGGMTRTGAWGISYAPDDPNRIYVGTDYGVAISTNNGASWSHRLLESTGPAAFSIQGLPRNRAITVTRQAIYLKEADDVWRVIRRGWFSAGWQYIDDGFKNIDVSPYDYDKVFILQNYNTLLLYEVTADSWTEIPLPGGGSRGPFVRAARGTTGPQSIDLFVGLGVALYKASCADMTCVRSLRCGSAPSSCDWRPIGRTEGVHDDSGHLGLDAQKRPVMYGSDGGLFKPQNAEATSWTLASPGGSGMNSYQMTSLAGTNYPRGMSGPSLYFATQDNAIWASPDGGRTWPNSDCAEGWHMQTWHQATSAADPVARVGYGSTGCWAGPRISDANLLNQRDSVAWRSTTGGAAYVTYESFLLSPLNWMRFEDGRYFSIDRTVGNWSLAMSTDNLERWREVGTTLLNPNSSVLKSGASGGAVTTYATFEGSLRDPSDNPRIAFHRMRDVLRTSPGTIIEDNLLYLPDRGNLGIRATEFDWHPIYGVDPNNPNFLIAPDVVNGRVWKSISGGDTWFPDDALTDLATQGGRLLLYDGHPYRLQVTEIAFSPYERNLIMVGTRDAGVIYSDNGGNTWQPIVGSEAMRYVTGFFFTPNGQVYVSTYGRGLWKIDMWWRWQEVPIIPICGFSYGDCIVRLRPEAGVNVIRDFPWKEHNVLIVRGGRVNGLVRSGDQVKSITVTPGSFYKFYAVEKQALPEITESQQGAGFQDDPAAEFALKNGEVITGVIFKGGVAVGYLTNKVEFKPDEEPIAPKPGKEVPGDKPGSGLPYLSISTQSHIGPGVVQTGGVVHLVGRGFIQGTPAEVLLDGQTLAQVTADKDGHVAYTVKVDDKLSLGQHRVEVVQKTQQGERKALATFVKVRGQDRFDRQ
ncbi:MAG TPA: sialidase family protein [Pyrinomonadaceae bacterium]